jgi:uncharacterized protein YjiS (DUF1127 family)
MTTTSATLEDTAVSMRARNTVSRAVGTVLTWRRRVRERAELAALDDWMLRDIGRTRADALLARLI